MQTDILDESTLPPLLAKFYARVREDADLGPVFNGAISDWDDHLVRLEEFWSSVMLTTGRYKGNPMAMHIRHAAAIRPEMFARWLDLWSQTTDEMLPGPVAREMQIRAARIAERLSFAVEATKTGELYRVVRPAP